MTDGKEALSLIDRYNAGGYDVSFLLEDVMNYLERYQYATDCEDRVLFDLFARCDESWDYDDNALEKILADAVYYVKTETQWL